MTSSSLHSRATVLFVGTALLVAPSAPAQDVSRPGHSIGKVSTIGNLITIELNPGALGKANLFDLQDRTLRFKPTPEGYRVETVPLRWDPDLGDSTSDREVTLHRFAFPFSNRSWTSFVVGTTGAIRFEKSANQIAPDPYGHAEAFALDRFDQLDDAANALIDSAPAICVFLKPRLSGPHYVKQSSDRVVITWELSEPFGGILDFTWFPTVNRFQAVLHRDGTIEMSYQQLSARDAIIGVYPALRRREDRLLTIRAPRHPAVKSSFALQSMTLSSIDRVRVRVQFTSRGPLPVGADSTLLGRGYRVTFTARAGADGSARRVSWAVNNIRDPYQPALGPEYFVFGPGASSNAIVSGNSVSIEGVLPSEIQVAASVFVSAQMLVDTTVVEQLPARAISLSQLRGARVHFSAMTGRNGPFPVAYEAFHYAPTPTPQDLSCTVIRALGDRFDFLVYNSDFRIDSQEATTPSFGPAAGNVSGIGQTAHDLATYCSHGRFQWAFAQPVYVDATEMYAQPPDSAPIGNDRDITFYLRQLSQQSPTVRPLPYNYAMSHIGHEMAHRWVAYVSARVGGQNVPLGPWPHWGPGLQTKVAFPYQLPIEASTIGGAVWQENPDSTFTLLRDGYFVPATGYSPLDLYLMGFLSASEVPDFFMLTNLKRVGVDSSGHRIYKADRTRLTIGDVIAAEGQRLPDPSHSQRQFNTGFVLIVEPGQRPSRTLIDRANGIRLRWMEFWRKTTGGRSTMTADPH